MKKYAVKGNHGDDHRRTTCAHEQQTTPTYHDAKKMRRHRGNRPRPKETEIGEPHCETIPNSPSPQNFYSLRSQNSANKEHRNKSTRIKSKHQTYTYGSNNSIRRLGHRKAKIS